MIHTKDDLDTRNELFSQYFGQEVIVNNDTYRVADGQYQTGDVIKLKDVGDISDLEALRIAEKLLSSSTEDSVKDELIHFGKHLVKDLFVEDSKLSVYELPMSITQQILDYLRQNGYALPFRNLSVEDQVKLNWLILEDHE